MRIDTTNSKSTHPSASRPLRVPRVRHAIDIEGRSIEINIRVGRIELRERRQRPSTKRDSGLDQASYTSCRIQMTHVCLLRPDRTETRLLRAKTKRFCQRC